MPALIRIVIGLILLVSGFEKAMNPHQNFLYVIQAYQMFPPWAEKLAALTVPWVELLVGLFMVLGLWVIWALKGSLLLFGAFVVIVSQALLRGLPIDQCGCFGEFLHVPPSYILVFDSLVVLALAWLLRNPSHVYKLSLDDYFNKKSLS
jgi:putative oxidoreductase